MFKRWKKPVEQISPSDVLADVVCSKMIMDLAVNISVRKVKRHNCTFYMDEIDLLWVDPKNGVTVKAMTCALGKSLVFFGNSKGETFSPSEESRDKLLQTIISVKEMLDNREKEIQRLDGEMNAVNALGDMF